jgi:hypothetical protein
MLCSTQIMKGHVVRMRPSYRLFNTQMLIRLVTAVWRNGGTVGRHTSLGSRPRGIQVAVLTVGGGFRVPQQHYRTGSHPYSTLLSDNDILAFQQS